MLGHISALLLLEPRLCVSRAFRTPSPAAQRLSPAPAGKGGGNGHLPALCVEGHEAASASEEGRKAAEPEVRLFLGGETLPLRESVGLWVFSAVVVQVRMDAGHSVQAPSLVLPLDLMDVSILGRGPLPGREVPPPTLFLVKPHPRLFFPLIYF